MNFKLKFDPVFSSGFVWDSNRIRQSGWSRRSCMENKVSE